MKAEVFLTLEDLKQMIETLEERKRDGLTANAVFRLSELDEESYYIKYEDRKLLNWLELNEVLK